MTVRLYCGHECKVREFGFPVSTKDYSRDGTRAVSYFHVCRDCCVDYLVNDTDSLLFVWWEEEEWLNNGR